GALRGGVRRGQPRRATLRRHARAGRARALTARRSAPGLWRLARHFGPHLKGQWLLVLASLGALFAEAGLQLLEPWPLKLVLDRVLGSSKTGSGPPFLNALDPTILLTLVAIGLVLITGLRALASYANTVGFALVGNRVLTGVRSAVYRHLQYLSLSFHTRARSGELALRVMSDVGVINDVAVTAILPLAATALVLWFGGRLVLDHALTAGDLVVFLSYLKSAFRPARDFAKYTGRLAKATAAGERVLDVLEEEPDVRDLPGARIAPAFSGALRFEGVSFAYESGHPVLDDVSFEVLPGQWVAVTGASGSGKSTLASLVLRLYDPHQ